MAPPRLATVAELSSSPIVVEERVLQRLKFVRERYPPFLQIISLAGRCPPVRSVDVYACPRLPPFSALTHVPEKSWFNVGNDPELIHNCFAKFRISYGAADNYLCRLIFARRWTYSDCIVSFLGYRFLAVKESYIHIYYRCQSIDDRICCHAHCDCWASRIERGYCVLCSCTDTTVNTILIYSVRIDLLFRIFLAHICHRTNLLHLHPRTCCSLTTTLHVPVSTLVRHAKNTLHMHAATENCQ